MDGLFCDKPYSLDRAAARRGAPRRKRKGLRSTAYVLAIRVPEGCRCYFGGKKKLARTAFALNKKVDLKGQAKAFEDEKSAALDAAGFISATTRGADEPLRGGSSRGSWRMRPTMRPRLDLRRISCEKPLRCAILSLAKLRVSPSGKARASQCFGWHVPLTSLANHFLNNPTSKGVFTLPFLQWERLAKRKKHWKIQSSSRAFQPRIPHGDDRSRRRYANARTVG